MLHNKTIFFVFIMIAMIQCVRPGEERSELDYQVGFSDNSTYSVTVVDGQAQVRKDLPTELVLWAQAPVLEITLKIKQVTTIRIEIRNCIKDSQVTLDSNPPIGTTMIRPTWCEFTQKFQKGMHSIFIAPADWDSLGTFRFVDMGDIQTAMSTVDEVFRAISDIPDIRFILSTGDVVETGQEEEYLLFEKQLLHLNKPFYSTIGNHELATTYERWHQKYGRMSIHFRFKNVDFSFVDSGNASIDLNLYQRLDQWLEQGKDRIHIFGTHFPPLDPIGLRNASFRNRNEGAMLLAKLAQGRVDLTLYGHVHSFYSFHNAGIPAFISGGGGAFPEKLDKIGRHFLVIEVDSDAGKLKKIEMVRVTPEP